MMFLIAGSGLLFWLLIAASLITISVLAICERTGLATFVVIGTAIGLHFFSTLPILAWMVANPLLVLGGIAAYLAVGVVWVYPKWMSFINDVHDTAMEARTEAPADFKNYMGDKESNVTLAMIEAKLMTDAIFAQFGAVRKNMPHSSTYAGYNGVTIADLGPEVGYNKARILSWMTYWPVSMFWTLLNDPIRRFYQWVYRSISGSLQRMSDNKFNVPVK